MANALDTDDLNRLPEVAEDKSGFFDYHSLGEGSPPDATAYYRLARSDTEEGEESAGQRLRIALVTGYDADADWLDVVSYQWRGEGDVVWAAERWEDARSLLGLYERDSDFDKRSAEDVHSEYKEGGPESVAEDAQRILGGGDSE
jgi:hypothetical protein